MEPPRWKVWAINRGKVENSDYTWEEMYRKQRRVPGLVLAMVSLFVYRYPEPWYAVLGLFLVAFSVWPAYGAYTYMRANE